MLSAKLNAPDPSVTIVCPAEPSAAGNANVMFEAIVAGAVNVTVFESSES